MDMRKIESYSYLGAFLFLIGGGIGNLLEYVGKFFGLVGFLISFPLSVFILIFYLWRLGW